MFLYPMLLLLKTISVGEFNEIYFGNKKIFSVYYYFLIEIKIIARSN